MPWLGGFQRQRQHAAHIDGLTLAYAHTRVLEVPDRPIQPEVLRPWLKGPAPGNRIRFLQHPELRGAPDRTAHAGLHRHVLARAGLLRKERPVPRLCPQSPAWAARLARCVAKHPRAGNRLRHDAETTGGLQPPGTCELPEIQQLVVSNLQELQLWLMMY